MKKLFIPLLVALPMLMVACKGSGSSSERSIPEGERITVTFYVDFNQKIAKNVYEREIYTWGDKIAKPADPAAPLDPAYPKFLGWSLKEVIDDAGDLYDFNTKISDEFVDSFMTIDLFGIWVA